MRVFMLVMALISAPAEEETWEPPENPDPSVILNEARADTRAQRYEIALAKLVWFHEQALAIQPALSGVRLSFALGYWRELAEKYPPAWEGLEATRDQAALNVKQGKNVLESFQDLAAINRELDQQTLTKDLFEELDKDHPDSALKVFRFSQPALIQTKSYALFAKYVVPQRDFRLIRQAYTAGKRTAGNPRFDKLHRDFANKKFVNDATTLVAILVINDRNAEALEIAQLAKQEWDDEDFHDRLDEALEGFVPEPWP
ncbi:MAG: hypothetical protein U0872_16845 [Planctomycetaceae bacterium]